VSAGIKANNDGSAAIQVGGSDYIEISAAGAVAIPGTLTVGGIPAGGNYVLESYVAPGIWDATTKIAAGLKAIKVTVVGAGGNGGPIGAQPVNVTSGSGGGGGGGAAIEYIPAPSIPGPQPVTAGAGTNSFGAFCSATAGVNAPAAPGSPTVFNTVTIGGAGGVGSGGNLNIAGQPGDSGSINPSISGNGGSSIFGGGANSVQQPGGGVSNGNAGQNYGGGGSGAAKVTSPLAATGGTGSPGIVIVEEFY
jgi:hypothetical protein